MNKRPEALEYFEEATKHKQQQYSHWVDMWLYDHGYRITWVGGLIPERFWDKEGCKRVVVRNNEVADQMRIPQTEEELLKLI